VHYENALRGQSQGQKHGKRPAMDSVSHQFKNKKNRPAASSFSPKQKKPLLSRVGFSPGKGQVVFFKTLR